MKASGSKNVNDSQTQSIVGDNTPTRLCYVDDSRTSAYVVKRLLRPYGYIVDHFDSAEPALIALVQVDYDLLLTDLKVSAKGMDGDDLVRALRTTGDDKISKMPIIVITGATDESILTEVYEAGANQIMNKPVSGDELDEEIRKLVSARKHKETGDNQEQDSIQTPVTNAKTAKKPNVTRSTVDSSSITRSSEIEGQKIGAHQTKQSGGTVIPFGTESVNARLVNAKNIIPEIDDDLESVVLEDKVDDIPTLGSFDVDDSDTNDAKNKPSSENNTHKQDADEPVSDRPARRVIRSNYTSSGAVRPQPASQVRPAGRVKPRMNPGHHRSGPPGGEGRPKNIISRVNNVNISKPVISGSPNKLTNDPKLANTPVVNGGSATNATGSNNTNQQRSELLSPSAKAALVVKKKAELAKKIRLAKMQKARLDEAAQIEKLSLEPLDESGDSAIKTADIFKKEPTISGDTGSRDTGSRDTGHVEAVQQKDTPVNEKSADIFAAPAVEPAAERPSEQPAEKTAEQPKSPADFNAPPPQFDGAANSNILEEMEKFPLVETDTGSSYMPSKFFSAIGSVLELYGLRRVFMSFIMLIGAYFAYLMFQDYYYQGIEVEVAVVQQGEIFQAITYHGKAVSKLKVNITPSISGRLTKIYIEEGDTVKSGELLARLDDREAKNYLSRANANLNSTREDVTMAKRSLDRLKRAFAKGAIAKQLVEDAEIELRSSKARRTISREEVQAAKLTLENPKIIAPFSGTITARYVEKGQWVVPSETLFTLIDEKQREIEVNVDAADSGGIAVGQTVKLSSDAFPGLEWSESVTRLAAATSNVGNANTVTVFISLGSNAPSLRFGQQVDADIRTAWNPNAIKVPYAAISNRKGSSWVAIVENGRVQFVEVITGIEDYSYVEILQGVNVGQAVILTNGVDLEQGDKVKLASNSM